MSSEFQVPNLKFQPREKRKGTRTPALNLNPAQRGRRDVVNDCFCMDLYGCLCEACNGRPNLQTIWSSYILNGGFQGCLPSTISRHTRGPSHRDVFIKAPYSPDAVSYPAPKRQEVTCAKRGKMIGCSCSGRAWRYNG